MSPLHSLAGFVFQTSKDCHWVCCFRDYSEESCAGIFVVLDRTTEVYDRWLLLDIATSSSNHVPLLYYLALPAPPVSSACRTIFRVNVKTDTSGSHWGPCSSSLRKVSQEHWARHESVWAFCLCLSPCTALQQSSERYHIGDIILNKNDSLMLILKCHYWVNYPHTTTAMDVCQWFGQHHLQ